MKYVWLLVQDTSWSSDAFPSVWLCWKCACVTAEAPGAELEIFSLCVCVKALLIPQPVIRGAGTWEWSTLCSHRSRADRKSDLGSVDPWPLHVSSASWASCCRTPIKHSTPAWFPPAFKPINPQCWHANSSSRSGAKRKLPCSRKTQPG